MNISIISGSPHKKGTSALLIDEFSRGAEQAGHIIYQFDAAFMQIKPCIACNVCRTNQTGACVHKDDMEQIVEQLIDTDAVVLATPLYYWGMTAQLKAVLDRFYSFEDRIRGGKKLALLATANHPSTEIMASLLTQYERLVSWMQWHDAGRVLAVGCGVRADIEASDYPRQAFGLGTELF